MVHGIDIFYWGLSLLFCLAFGFAILLWARGWRREEREASARRDSELAEQVARLAAAVDQLEHTAASLRTADELLAQGIKDLQSVRVSPPPAPTAPQQPTRTEAPAPPAEPAPAKADPAPAPETDEDRYEAARQLLKAGHSPTDVARKLDIGAAEAKMLARIVQRERSADESE